MDKRILFAGIAFLMTVSAPALAQQLDGGALTCAEFVVMDAAGKNASLNAVRGFVRESANASASGTVAQTEQLTDAEFMGRMDAACIDVTTDETIINAMR